MCVNPAWNSQRARARRAPISSPVRQLHFTPRRRASATVCGLTHSSVRPIRGPPVDTTRRCEYSDHGLPTQIVSKVNAPRPR